MISVVATSPVQSSYSGKFAACFDIIRDTGKEIYVSASCESGAVFDTEEDARAAAQRAVEYYNANDGRFPNMCEYF